MDSLPPHDGSAERGDRRRRSVAARDLWRALNRARAVDGAAVRLASLALLAFYAAGVLLRPMPDQPLAPWVRGAVCVCIALGIAFGPRFTWRALRLFTVGLALALNLAIGSLILLRGPVRGDLGVQALAMFAPTAFLQTGMDVIGVVVALGSLVAAVLATTPLDAPNTVAIDLYGALLTGAVTALALILFRDRVSTSTAWWQEACARERALREFSEGIAPQLGEAVAARELAGRLRQAFGTGHCAIVTIEPGGAPRVLATAGVWAGVEPSAASLLALVQRMRDRQPFVASRVAESDLPWATLGGTLVALPMVFDDAVAGAIVLSATGPRPAAEEEVLMWRAMASQVCTALDSARLFARLQEALRARSEFVNTMSHELRSPLHVIIGYGEMLAEQRADPAVAAARIRANALELLHLVENTLTVGRLSGGGLAVHPSEFELSALFDELRESVAALPEARAAASVRWQIDGPLPPLHLDRLKVKEVVHNLVSNALKFAGAEPVRVRAAADGDRLRIDVSDSGPGIAPADQARIFGLFERGDGDAVTGGSGLGLYIVKSLAQLMGGDVTVSSSPGRGACFTAWLPFRLDRG